MPLVPKRLGRMVIDAKCFVIALGRLGWTMDIRPARGSDRLTLVALCRRVIRSNYAAFLPAEVLDPWLASDAVEKYTAAHMEACHVAEEDDEVVACYVRTLPEITLLPLRPMMPALWTRASRNLAK